MISPTGRPAHGLALPPRYGTGKANGSRARPEGTHRNLSVIMLNWRGVRRVGAEPLILALFRRVFFTRTGSSLRSKTL
jgi:hypothetical protein